MSITSGSTMSIINNDSNLNESSLNLDELTDLEDEMNQMGVTKLTQILAILGICISVIGIMGNFFSIIVLCKKSMKKLSTYAYLLGLSICDEISLTFTVIILLHYALPFGMKLSQTFVNNHKIMLIYVYPIVASTQALSVWITLAFTVDRYLYVCQPYFGREYCTRKRAFIVLSSLFLIASLYSIPQFMERTYDNIDLMGRTHIFLNLTSLGRNKYFIYIYHLFIYSAFVCIIPIVTIVILNGFLVFDIIRSNRRHREISLNYNNRKSFVKSSSTSRNLSELRKPSKLFSIFCNRKKPNLSAADLSAIESCISNTNNNGTSVSAGPPLPNGDKNFTDKTLRNDVTIMLIGLIFVFLICQLPSTILRLITFQNLAIQFQPVYYSSLDVSNFLIVTNSTLNCILYVMLGQKFRKEFFNTFLRKFSNKHSAGSNNTAY